MTEERCVMLEKHGSGNYTCKLIAKREILDFEATLCMNPETYKTCPLLMQSEGKTVRTW